MEYYSALKKNKIMPFAAPWMDIDIVILSELRQRRTNNDILYMWSLKRNDKNELAQQKGTHQLRK